MRIPLQKREDISESELPSVVQHRVIKLSIDFYYKLFHHVSISMQAEQEDDMQMIPSSFANIIASASAQTVHLVFPFFERVCDWIGICDRDDIKTFIHDLDDK